MIVVQENASQEREQSHSPEEKGQSSNNNEEQQQQHFADLSRTFSSFEDDEIPKDLWQQQSGGFETFDDISHVANTLAIDDDVSSRDASSSTSQVVRNQAPAVAHYDVPLSTMENVTQFAATSSDIEDRMINVPSQLAAKAECVKRSVPQRLMIENLISHENSIRSPFSCIAERKRRMSDPGTLVVNLDRVSASLCSETPIGQTPRWESWQEFAIVNSPTSPAVVETEETAQKLKELIRYLPKLLLRKALSNPDTVATQPAIDVFQAAVLIADITGFTPLTEHALTSKRGSELVEELTVSMNNYFDESQSKCALRAAACGFDLVSNLGAYTPQACVLQLNF